MLLAWVAPGDAVEMPGPSDVGQAIAQLKCNKACGPDGLPGDVFKMLPASFATLLMPLALKLRILREEAAGLKGSLLTWLYKQRGARNLCHFLPCNYASAGSHQDPAPVPSP